MAEIHTYIIMCSFSYFIDDAVYELPPVGGEVEGHTQALLASLDILFVELVALFHCTVACILQEQMTTHIKYCDEGH